MEKLTIFSDSGFEGAAGQLLRDGIAPHDLLEPKTRLTSVLAKPEPDTAFGQADIAFGQPDVESIRASEKLKWLQVSSAGITRYDTPEFRELAKERGLIVTNSSSVYATACAEHALAFMMAQSRLLPAALASQAPNGDAEWRRLRGGSVSLHGQHVVLLGFGAIARELMRLLKPFSMRFTAMRRSPRGDEGCEVVTPENLISALTTADQVVNILPENEESQGFINAARLAVMKPGAVFHNIGRGTTVNQQDLLDALTSGHLAAAWLDVTDPEPLPPDHPLRHEPNCFITPHIAGGHRGESETLVRHFLKNLAKFTAGEALDDRVM
jgi:phosphoglycerate dehydrogenase-like enzyme